MAAHAYRLRRCSRCMTLLFRPPLLFRPQVRFFLFLDQPQHRETHRNTAEIVRNALALPAASSEVGAGAAGRLSMTLTLLVSAGRGRGSSQRCLIRFMLMMQQLS